MNRAAILLLPAALACGGETRPAEVRLTVDEASCASSSPEAIALPCGGAVGVWLRDAATEEILEQRCVSFSSARQTLGELPAILSAGGVSLRIAEEQPVIIELAVYGPRQSGCPAPEQGGQPVQFARSEPVVLEGERPAVSLSLECLDSAAPCGEEDGEDKDEQLEVAVDVLDLERLELVEQDTVLEIQMVAAALAAPSEAELEPLGSLSGAGPFWSGEVLQPPPDAACVGTLIESSEGVFLTCIEPGFEDSLELFAYTLEEGGEQIFGEIPRGGAVLGRLTSGDDPAPAEFVTADDPSYTILTNQDWFLAYREEGTPDCCVSFRTEELDAEPSAPIAVLPGVVSLVHLDLR